MEKRYFGAIIKVRNLDTCRHFYRNILNLGDPIADSNVWVEFRLADGGILVLEKTDSEPLVQTDHIRWFFATDDVNGLLSRLSENGFQANEKLTDALGYKLYEITDPDGNPFLIYPLPTHPDAPLY